MKNILTVAILCGAVHMASPQNFGIDEPNPTEKLHVNGNSLVTGNTYIGSTDAFFFRDAANRIATTSQFYVQTSSANTYLYSTNTYLGASSGSNIHLRGNPFDWTSGGGGIINALGNVGIGTTSPATKLHVSGGIVRTHTRVSSSQSYPIGQGYGLFPINPTWTNEELQAYFNYPNVSWINDATAPAGWAIQITGYVPVGGIYNSGFPYIPIEEGATYYMECWIKNTSGSNGHYMGSIDYDHNFSSLGGNPGSYGYWVMSNTNPGSSWTKVSGTIGGFGSAVGTFKPGSKYWTPQALFNYTGGGTCEISGWKVTKSDVGSNAGSVVTRWGNGSAPSGTTLLYTGWGHTAHYEHPGGSSMCMQGGEPGPTASGTTYGDLLYPMGTGDAARCPPGITTQRQIRCAVVHAQGPTFEVWGSENCPSGWTRLYRGYSMGEYYNHAAGKEKPFCVDSDNFDTSRPWVWSSGGSYMSGSYVWGTSDATNYPTNRWVRCAVCVKQ